jgi:hypothetical protein
MRTFSATLLKDLTYIQNCRLQPGARVQVTQTDSKTHFILDAKSNQVIRLFYHDFETV